MTNGEYQELIEFLGRQFADVDRRFDAIDGRFAIVDRRFDAIDDRFDTVDRRFEGVDARLSTIDPRFDALDDRFGIVDRRFDTMERRSDARFDAIEAQLRDILGHFDQLYVGLDRLEQEYQAIVQALRRIEARLGSEQERREILERSVDELKRHVFALHARIEELEQRLRQ